MSLEDKLRFYYNAAKQEADMDKWIDGVKQAYKDKGYIKVSGTQGRTFGDNFRIGNGLKEDEIEQD